ncbi:MAG: ATP-dependent helicase [Bacteroidetes bacterium]|nr:ATP-dependent helicase [Bacteroidota bacterium]
MFDVALLNPAELASQRALDEVFRCIREKKSFRLEAGAGAGKTYSLVRALNLLIEENGSQFVRQNKRVACITYTNVATAEIVRRTDGNPIIQASTIHSFCWDLCKSFQSALRTEVLNIPQLAEKINEAGGIRRRRINYELGHRRVTDNEILLHHDDVLKLTVALMENRKFRRILSSRFPVLFIDEYQDTDKDFADSIIRNFVETERGPLIGLFGDSWQKIYPTGAGSIDHPKLRAIGKEANFRSAPAIVDVLNRIRPELPQQVSNPAAIGSAKVFHTNSFAGQRQTGGHWGGDLPATDAHNHLEALRRQLASVGWDFSPKNTKILMLTHNVLASEQNYSQILGSFDFTDGLIRKEDPHIAFLVDTVEPACAAFCAGRFGEMFDILGNKAGRLTNQLEKLEWARDMRQLIQVRETGTIGEVLQLLKETRKPQLPDSVLRTQQKLESSTPEEIESSVTLKQINRLKLIPYTELISLAAFINDHTPFATKHGVKGAEFENVLVVFGRGWNHYNWSQFLEWFPNRFPGDKEATYLRNRNLFYVACSRPKNKLVLLFTQSLSVPALETLQNWFGAENVSEFAP